MRSGFEPESQTPCSIGLVVIKSMQVKAREQAPLLCSGSAFSMHSPFPTLSQVHPTRAPRGRRRRW